MPSHMDSALDGKMTQSQVLDTIAAAATGRPCRIVNTVGSRPRTSESRFHVSLQGLSLTAYYPRIVGN